VVPDWAGDFDAGADPISAPRSKTLTIDSQFIGCRLYLPNVK
jgi:hypothetical protein